MKSLGHTVKKSMGAMSIALAMCSLGHADVPGGGLNALVGRWQLDPSRTHMGRFGPNGNNLVRSPTFTFIFSPKGKTLNVSVYAKYPQEAPTRTMALIPDGLPHQCEDKAACLTVGGDAKEQSYIYRQIDSHFVMRLFLIMGVISEYSTYAVSSDGRTFTLISWSPETPYFQNIQVFDRQQ